MMYRMSLCIPVYIPLRCLYIRNSWRLCVNSSIVDEGAISKNEFLIRLRAYTFQLNSTTGFLMLIS